MKRRNNGFSLVEMAVVLIIFGLVLAAASSILTLFVNKGGSERTRKMIESNKNALFSIAASEGYLQAAAVDTKPANISLNYPKDAYGTAFYLITDAALGYTTAKDQLDYKPICGANGTALTLDICDDIDCNTSTTVTDVAFVIISGSENKNVQTESVSGAVKIYYQGQSVDDQTATGINRVEKYDDIADWVTLPELRVKAGCDPEKLRFLDTAMPVVQDGEPYNFDIYAEGGVPYAKSGAPTVSEYDFTLDDDDGFLGHGVTMTVMSESTAVGVLTALNPSEKGTHLSFTGNATTMPNASYRVIITIEDDSAAVGGINNSTQRTLYIKRQD